MDMQDELIDRFGEMPKSAINLLNIAFIKAIAHRCKVTEIKGALTGPNWVTSIKMYPQAELRTENIPVLIKEYERELRFVAGREPFFTFTLVRKNYPDADSYLERMKELLKVMEEKLLDF